MRWRLAVLGGVALAVGIACKGTPSESGNGCKSTLADVVISTQDNLSYDKPSVTISVQQRVCWDNPGTLAHSVTALVTDTVTNGTNTIIDTLWNIDGQVNPDLVVLASFNKLGDYPYHCRYHQAQGMTGVIHVR
jgi:plastocyanin